MAIFIQIFLVGPQLDVLLDLERRVIRWEEEVLRPNCWIMNITSLHWLSVREGLCGGYTCTSVINFQPRGRRARRLAETNVRM